MNLVRIVCVVGPTGSGKTAVALALAQALDGEIINADSRQVYRDFPIITAQPNEQEQGLRPHHLYGFLPTEEKLSAGRWAETAFSYAQKVTAHGRVPICVGGTGLYVRTLLEGIAAIPPVDASVHRHWLDRCAVEGTEALHALLSEVDPPLAARVHPRDSQRIVRGLEVWQGTGRPLTWWHNHAANPPACMGLRLGLASTLAELTPRLDARIDAMLALGAVQEARAAYTLCDDISAPGWSGIGCAELFAYITGQTPWQETRALWLRNTRAYAKRQLTWFKADRHIDWYAPNAVEDMCVRAKYFLNIDGYD